MTVSEKEDSLEFSELAESERATGASVRNLETTLSSTYVRSVISGTEQASEGSCIIAIGESRGAATEIGIAIYDCAASECRVGQFSDATTYSRTLHLLALHLPLKVLYCTGSLDAESSKLVGLLEELYQHDVLWPLARSEFNETEGYAAALRLATPASLTRIQTSCRKKYYAYSAIAALFAYIERDVGVELAQASLNFRVVDCDTMTLIGSTECLPAAAFIGTVLDYQTNKALGLVPSGSSSRSGMSLFQALCSCRTLMGQRLLRTCILQPLTSVAGINTRLDAVQELILHKDLLVSMKACLEGVPDVNKIIKAAVYHDHLQLSTKYGEALIHQALLLRQLLASLTELSALLEGQRLTSSLFSDAIQVIKASVLVELRGYLDECLEEGLCYSGKQSLQQNQRLFAVRSGFSALLDVARRTFKEVQDDIHEFAAAWAQHANVKISVKFQSKRGYFFSIQKSDLEGRDLNALCRTHVVKRLEILFSPLELAKLNERLKECMSEILLASQKVLEELMIRFKERLDSFYAASDVLAELDLLCCFADVSERWSGVRPEFGPTLAVRNSRHPYLLAMNEYGGAVANDYFAEEGRSSFVLVTGANMSGKSTYIRQLALLAIMAQMGCFVPAEYAAFPLYRHFLTRIGSDDDLEANASSFAVEMKEIVHALGFAQDRCLMLIDELGRGTGMTEGVAVAMAVSDALLETPNTTVCMVTHFGRLIKYLEGHPRVAHIRLHSELCPLKKGLRFSYRASASGGAVPHYGMHLARKAKLPDEMLQLAQRALARIKDAEGDGPATLGVRKAVQKRKLVFQTAERIDHLEASTGLDEETKTALLAKTRAQFEHDLDGLDEETG